jgi:hypothetical protein
MVSCIFVCCLVYTTETKETLKLIDFIGHENILGPKEFALGCGSKICEDEMMLICHNGKHTPLI